MVENQKLFRVSKLEEQAINREIEDKISEGLNLGNLGMIYQNLGQTEKAIKQ